MSHLLRRVALTVCVVLGLTAPAFARGVTIAWDANTEPDLAGYVVRYGTESQTYTAAVDVGNRTDFALTLDEFTTYYVVVEAYNVSGERSTVSDEVVVFPDYSSCTVSLDRAGASIGGVASSLTLGVATESACPWTVTSYSSWITMSGRTTSTGSGSVSLAFATNNTGVPRVGAVLIGDRALLVTQNSVPCTVTAAMVDFGVFPKEGGTASVDVEASSPACGWNATSNAPWLTFSGGSSRAGSGRVTFTVAANASTMRVGHLTVAGRVYSIVQQPRRRSDALDFDGRGADAFVYYKPTGEWKRLTWDGTFALTQAGMTLPGMKVLPADFNRDGRSDLFGYDVRTGRWARSISGADGTVQLVESIWQTGWEQPMIVDLNGDGRSDVFFYSPRTGNWIQWITDPTTLAFTQYTGHFGPGWTLFLASFDGNSRDDLFLYNANPATSDPNAGKWAQMLTQPDLTFLEQPGESAWAERATILPIDFNGDGVSEIFSLTPAGRWTVSSFTAEGVTATSGSWSPGWQPLRGEFNGDGVPDLLLYNPATGAYGVSILSGNAFFTVKGAWAQNLSLSVTDLNGDGASDVVAYDQVVGSWGAAIATSHPGVFVLSGGRITRSQMLLASHQRQP